MNDSKAAYPFAITMPFIQAFPVSSFLQFFHVLELQGRWATRGIKVADTWWVTENRRSPFRIPKARLISENPSTIHHIRARDRIAAKCTLGALRLFLRCSQMHYRIDLL